MTQMKLAVFGCGPSGLIAAETARELGAQVTVFSLPKPSYIAGAQYLHTPVFGLTGETPETYIRVERRGTREAYAEKVYGNPAAPVSWDLYEDREYPAWNMRRVYSELWEQWGPQIFPVKLDPTIATMAAELGIIEFDSWRIEIDTVINTVPLRELCRQPAVRDILAHNFTSQQVHIRQEEVDVGDAWPEDKMVYSGEPDVAWYRESHIFGHVAREYPGLRSKPPLDDITTIYKPLDTNCDCYSTTSIPFILAGRYGAWKKKSLVHDVVGTVEELMDENSL